MDNFIILGGDSHLGKAFKKMYPESIVLDKKTCDITSYKSITSALERIDAKYVLNCAAITDIELCQDKEKECFEVNAFAPKKVEEVCMSLGKKLIQISSDYALFPINIYGKSKELLEKNLDKNKTLIVRTSFYYEDYKPFTNLMSDKVVNGYCDVYFNPVSIYRLAEEIFKHKDEVGLINIFSSKKISKYDLMLIFCNSFGIDNSLLSKSRMKDSESTVPRPFDTFVKTDVDIDLKSDMEYFKKKSSSI